MSKPVENKTVVIVGGSTGGASVAAQIRRRDEHVRIILVEKTHYVSTAYCGLAYAAGGIVQSRDELIPLKAEQLQKQFNIEVLLNTTVLSIDAKNKQVKICKNCSEDSLFISYTKLLLAPGARSVIPNIEGNKLPGVFTLRNISDLDQILGWEQTRKIKSVLVVGAGFIGLELAESFTSKGYAVHLVEAGGEVMPKMDTDLKQPIHQHLRVTGVELYLNTTVNHIEYINKQHHVSLSNGQKLNVDMVLLVTGIQTENQLANEAGLNLGPDDGISVNSMMQTSDKDIFAIGDAVQMLSRITSEPVMVALAATLSQQARVAAANITGTEMHYRGPVGSFVCKVFDLTVASTGVSEAHLKRYKIPYRKVIVPTTNHVFFYPGCSQILLKVLFDANSGRLLGAQAVGGEGTDKRIDILATSIAASLTIFDLDQLELCYAPPYGAPRDPVNLAGSIGAALLNNDIAGVYPDELAQLENPFIIDIRTLDEHLASTIPGATHIAAHDLRDKVNQIPRDRVVIVMCSIGSKANSSQRMLSQLGYNCYNLLGGFLIWQLFHPEDNLPKPLEKQAGNENTIVLNKENIVPSGEGILDVRGLTCPGPIVTVSKRMKKLEPGSSLEVIMSDPSVERDINVWARNSNYIASELIQRGTYYTFTLSKR